MAASGASRGLALAVVAAFCAPDVARAEEGAEDSTNKALGLTMMGGIFLVVGMYYLTHYSDHDIRKITWSTINNTLSIFCAVILFKNASQFADGLLPFYDRSSLGYRIFLNRGWTAFWYGCLMVAIYVWCAGLGRGREWREAVLQCKGQWEVVKEETKTCMGPDQPSYQRTKSRMKCCLFLAHTTGFAGLAGWGMKTNTEWFSQSPARCALLIPEAVIWYVIIIQLLQLGRRQVAASSIIEKEDPKGKPDELLLLAEEQLEDGENDFFGLFMSFLVVTTLRFAIGGNLPNEEGEEGENVFKHSRWQAFLMYLMSGAFFVLAYGILKWKHQITKDLGQKKDEESGKKEEGKKEQDKTESDEEEEEQHRAYSSLTSDIWDSVGIGRTGWHKIARKESARTMSRVVEMGVNTVSFSFAWCFMYATQWLIAPSLEGEELVLGIVLAIVITLCSCGLVYKLDQLADHSEERSVAEAKEKVEAVHGSALLTSNGFAIHEETDIVHRKLMESTGILIGFVWEQCFDVALAGIASEDNLWLKPCLGILTVGVIMPVWLWYIVPMETSSGYILGFLPKTMHWRLQNLELDSEPEVKREVKEQVKEVLEVMWNQNAALLKEVLREFLVDPSRPHESPRKPDAVDCVLEDFEQWRRKLAPGCSGYQPPPPPPPPPPQPAAPLRAAPEPADGAAKVRRASGASAGLGL